MFIKVTSIVFVNYSFQSNQSMIAITGNKNIRQKSHLYAILKLGGIPSLTEYILKSTYTLINPIFIFTNYLLDIIHISAFLRVVIMEACYFIF